MEEFRVKLLKAAERDLLEIVKHLNTLEPSVAIQYYDLIIEQLDSLKAMPTRCSRVRNPALKVKGYHFLVVKSYIIFFVVRGAAVQVRRILYGKRNLQELL
ncbi:MAG: type II toxin-antitoxin system RelE/ParE family toxin [Oscillospiraceae bacterium]|nr:type II toxin-antitoxin system RelE/ParE family toxin [Oscillospiraceae bacterium]